MFGIYSTRRILLYVLVAILLASMIGLGTYYFVKTML